MAKKKFVSLPLFFCFSEKKEEEQITQNQNIAVQLRAKQIIRNQHLHTEFAPSLMFRHFVGIYFLESTALELPLSELGFVSFSAPRRSRWSPWTSFRRCRWKVSARGRALLLVTSRGGDLQLMDFPHFGHAILVDTKSKIGVKQSWRLCAMHLARLCPDS